MGAIHPELDHAPSHEFDAARITSSPEGHGGQKMADAGLLRLVISDNADSKRNLINENE
jgi:hypothetical protein